MITKAVKEPPICDVVKVVGETAVIQLVQFELVKMAERISVSGNITPAQLNFISGQLVSMFPAESLADFKICFERGCMGQYGEIYRMDGIVLRNWMNQYLDEKYQVVEMNWDKMKEEEKKVIIPADPEKDWHKVWLDAVKDENARPRFDIPEQQILEEGQVKPKRVTYPSTDEHEIRKRELHLQWIRESFHPTTGDKLEGFLEESEWLKSKGL